jgi:hypothetical protein
MMGVVYRAHDPALGRDVALKTVQLSFPIDDDQKASFEQRFLAEARAAAGLSHPAIVVVHDVGRDDASGTPFIALEYLHGQTLSERLAAGRLPAAEALRLAAALARGLHHAHAHGIVHRDVKPANIMILESGAPKLMDFGVAKLPASQLTAAGEFFGTPAYMSPEQAMGAVVDGRSDLFSLGCVLYVMLTGERAFDGPSVPTILAMIAHKDVPPPSSRVAALSPAVDAVLARSLAKDPARRYPDGNTLADDLEDVANGRPPRHTAITGSAPVEPTRALGRADRAAAPVLPRSARPYMRHVFLLIGVVGALVLVGAGLLLIPAALRSRLLDSAMPGRVPSARLALSVEHPLKSGTLRVFVDDEPQLEEKLESKVVQKILSVEIRKGTLERTLSLPPGEHVIRVQVDGENFSASRRITGTFTSGEERGLHAELEGLLKRDVRLNWTGS